MYQADNQKPKKVSENPNINPETGQPTNMGRPRKEFDYKLLENLCSIQCTLTEVCDIMDVSDTLLTQRCKEHYGLTFKGVYNKYSSNGKASLRRAQFKYALKGNHQLLIWLGKQELGQTDKQEITHREDPMTGLLEYLRTQDSIDITPESKQITHNTGENE